MVIGCEQSPYGTTGQPFNEIVVDAAGRAWVDMPGAAPWEARKPGIVAVVLPDGSSRQAASDVWFPNGMVRDRRRHLGSGGVARRSADGVDDHGLG